MKSNARSGTEPCRKSRGRALRERAHQRRGVRLQRPIRHPAISLRATYESGTTSCTSIAMVTTVYDLERESLAYDYGNYRSRRRSKSRDNVSGSGYGRDSGTRFHSRTRSTSRGRSSSRRRSNSMGSSYNHQKWQSPKIGLSNYTNKLRGVYNKKVMSNVDAYVRDTAQNAIETNNINFLMRCASHRLIPVEYWVDASKIRKTREVLRFLEQCASRLMLEDIRMHKKETETLSRSIARSKDFLRQQLSDRDFTRLERLVKAHFQELFDAVRRQQRDNFARLQQLSHNNGDQTSQKQGSPNKGQGRQGRRSGRHDSERKSRSGSDSSSVPTSD